MEYYQASPLGGGWQGGWQGGDWVVYTTRKCKTLRRRAWANWCRSIVSLMSWYNIFKILISLQVDTMDPSLSNSMPMDPLNARLLTVYVSSIKPSLPYLGPLWSPSFLFSLAPALQSRSRCNLSFTLSKFISIELHGEESSIAIHHTEH